MLDLHAARCAVVAAAFFSAACGGGGSETPPPQVPTLEVTSCGGTVDAAECLLAPALVGATPSTGTLTLRNAGPGGPLVVSEVGTAIVAPFSIGADGCTGQSLGVGETCTLEIVFEPTAGGAATGQFTFATNAPGDETVTVSVSARGQDSDAVYGTVTLPAGAIGKCVTVALDDDADPSNGAASNGGVLLAFWVRATSTSEAFEITGVSAGSYYLFTFVDMDESNSDPDACFSTGAPTVGDLFGYDGDAPLPPIPAVPTVDVLATSATTFHLTPLPLLDSAAGTVTLPQAAVDAFAGTGACVVVALDDDADRNNGVFATQVARATSTSHAFSFTGLPAGTYYLLAVVDMDGNNTDPGTCASTGAPNSGDYYGYHGDSPTVPTVPIMRTLDVSFDFGVAAIP